MKANQWILTEKEFEDIEKAIKHANRYAKGIRFAGVQVKDENLETVFEITSDFDVCDYRMVMESVRVAMAPNEGDREFNIE